MSVRPFKGTKALFSFYRNFSIVDKQPFVFRTFVVKTIYTARDILRVVKLVVTSYYTFVDAHTTTAT